MVLRRTGAVARARDDETGPCDRFCGHAGAEPVIALTLEHAWLKCSLHGGYLFTSV